MSSLFFFFFNDTATTEIYTLSLHDALPIYVRTYPFWRIRVGERTLYVDQLGNLYGKLLPAIPGDSLRSEEHTSELQSHLNLVCRLLLEKKKITQLQRQRRTRRRSACLHDSR